MHRLSAVMLGLGIVALSAVGCNRPVAAGPRAEAAKVADIRDLLKSAAGDSTSASAAGPAEATGWATLRGAFRFDGQAPPPEKLNVDKDAEVCGKENLVNEQLIVSAGGGLQGSVIYARTPKLPVHPDYAKSASAQVVLDNKNCRFEPHVLVMRTTQALVIKNSDPIGHNTKIDPAKNTAFNQIISANEQVKLSMAQEETAATKFGCSIHTWMGGYAFIRNDPYAAASDKDGNFLIANLPAGMDLEFQLWHERAQAGLKGVDIAGVKVDAKGRFKLKLQPGEEMALEIKVPPAALK